MESNKVYKNLEKFASTPVSFRKFMSMLKSTSDSNRMTIYWRTAIIPTHRTVHEMYWGQFFSNSDQSFAF